MFDDKELLLNKSVSILLSGTPGQMAVQHICSERVCSGISSCRKNVISKKCPRLFIKTVSKLLCLMFVSLVIAVLCTEMIARVLYPEIANSRRYLDDAFTRLLNSDVTFDPNRSNFSKKFGFILSPNSEHIEQTSEFTATSRTNSIGFRTREVQPKQENEYRIMLVGDSMFWGVGVDESETISSVTEEFGRHRFSQQISVYNYSISGYNTVQELIVAKTYIDSLQPDHIILGVFIGNDILPNVIAFIDEDGNYNTSVAAETNMKNALKKKFGLFFHSIIFRIVALSAYIPRLRYQFAHDDEAIVKSYALLDEFDHFAKNHATRFSVVIFYPRDAVNGGMIEAWSQSRDVGNLLNSFCRQHEIETLDLLAYMHTPEHKERYFFQHDGHPNREGNAVIAAAMFDKLVKPHMIQRQHDTHESVY